AAAWEPAPGGVQGEFRSTKTYPALAGKGRRNVPVLGNFADSMVPLHGYRFRADFVTANPYWSLTNNIDPNSGVYCGPGLWFDPDTKRTHARRAHPRLKSLGRDNYRGETDPRKLPLVVAGAGSPLRLVQARHVRLVDLVVRGSAGHTLQIDRCAGVE